jgi:hypothetical protein
MSVVRRQQSHRPPFTPRKIPGTESTLRVIVQLKGLDQLKNSVTSEIERATFWLIA